MSEARTHSQESEQPRRRRGLLEEIQRMREGASHRKIWRSDRQRSLLELTGGTEQPAIDRSRDDSADLASVRRDWQNRRRIVRLMRLFAAGLALVAGAVFVQNRGLAEAACRETESFLGDGARSLWGAARERCFSSCLKTAEPPDRFAKDIQLLESKLGRLNRYALTSASVSPFGGECEVAYELVFERGEARGFFAMMQEDGRWVVDTFCFWAPAWKKL